MADKEPFGISEQLEKDHFADPGNMVGDLISRQAAIDVLDELCQEHRYKIPGKRETYSQYNEAWQDALDRAEGAIFNLPSAQPTVDAVPIRRGEWIDVHFRTVPYNRITSAKKCSYCGKKKDKYVQWNYCPNCGAIMDGKDGDGNE